MKIAVITCYGDPEHKRAVELRNAIKGVKGVRPLVIKNRHRGWARYPEVLWRLWRLKRQHSPEAYLLTFRGQELLPFVLALAGKRPVIFDEYIVPMAYAAEERAGVLRKGMKQRLSRWGFPRYSRWLRRCSAVLAGSAEAAEQSARLAHMNLSAYTIIAASDEELSIAAQTAITRQLTVLVNGLNA